MAKEHQKLEKGMILSRFIIEMLGAPKEHVEKTMRDYIESLKGDKEIEIVKVNIADAEKQDNNFFSTYTEIEVWMKNIDKLVGFCFDALPSSVEIIEPETLRFSGSQLAGLLNDLQAKLHKID